MERAIIALQNWLAQYNIDPKTVSLTVHVASPVTAHAFEAALADSLGIAAPRMSGLPFRLRATQIVVQEGDGLNDSWEYGTAPPATLPRLQTAFLFADGTISLGKSRRPRTELAAFRDYDPSGPDTPLDAYEEDAIAWRKVTIMGNRASVILVDEFAVVEREADQ
ncbi:MAG: hypothetical protein KF723_22025 [Rhizobiaceae bacterium]|nr:hypothetical protein [Rhizobiaceae bacterium]